MTEVVVFVFCSAFFCFGFVALVACVSRALAFLVCDLVWLRFVAACACPLASAVGCVVPLLWLVVRSTALAIYAGLFCRAAFVVVRVAVRVSDAGMLPQDVLLVSSRSRCVHRAVVGSVALVLGRIVLCSLCLRLFCRQVRACGCWFYTSWLRRRGVCLLLCFRVVVVCVLSLLLA